MAKDLFQYLGDFDTLRACPCTCFNNLYNGWVFFIWFPIVLLLWLPSPRGHGHCFLLPIIAEEQQYNLAAFKGTFNVALNVMPSDNTLTEKMWAFRKTYETSQQNVCWARKGFKGHYRNMECLPILRVLLICSKTVVGIISTKQTNNEFHTCNRLTIIQLCNTNLFCSFATGIKQWPVE